MNPENTQSAVDKNMIVLAIDAARASTSLSKDELIEVLLDYQKVLQHEHKHAMVSTLETEHGAISYLLGEGPMVTVLHRIICKEIRKRIGLWRYLLHIINTRYKIGAVRYKNPPQDGPQ